MVMCFFVNKPILFVQKYKYALLNIKTICASTAGVNIKYNNCVKRHVLFIG